MQNNYAYFWKWKLTWKWINNRLTRFSHPRCTQNNHANPVDIRHFCRQKSKNQTTTRLFKGPLRPSRTVSSQTFTTNSLVSVFYQCQGQCIKHAKNNRRPAKRETRWKRLSQAKQSMTKERSTVVCFNGGKFKNDRFRTNLFRCSEVAGFLRFSTPRPRSNCELAVCSCRRPFDFRIESSVPWSR